MTRQSERRWWLAALAFYGRRLANAVYVLLRRAVLKLLDGLDLLPAEVILVESVRRLNATRIADDLRQATDRALTLAIAAGALHELDAHATGAALVGRVRGRLTGVVPFIAGEWFKIAESFVTAIIRTLRRFIIAGGSAPAAVKLVRVRFRPEVLKRRAERIGETEAQTAINTGKYAARLVLLPEGFINAQTWETMQDSRVRDAHEHAQGQTVSINGLFTVGGELCRYPGDPSLSAANRINCRCFTVAKHLSPDELAKVRGGAFAGASV